MPLYPVHEVQDLKNFNECYINLFKTMLLRFSDKFDKTLNEFLKQGISLNENFDQERIKTDHAYALQCMLIFFY